MAHSNTKVKQTSKSFRIWIEGKKLIDSGFKPNARYNIEYLVKTKTIILEIAENGKRKVSNSKRNGIDRPIIDLESKKIGILYEEGKLLLVSYLKHKIIIQESNKTKQENISLPNPTFTIPKKKNIFQTLFGV
jgi:hypothetical protein